MIYYTVILKLSKTFVIGLMAFTMGVSTTVNAEPDHSENTFSFKPIKESANSSNWNAAAPWEIPEGYTQTRVSGEASLNIYDGGRDDWHDMNTVNETGAERGRYLYRTHEVRNAPEGGAISVIDLQTGETKILAQNKSWNAVDGIRWTPWGTILFAEEVTGGRLFEIYLEPNNPMKALKVVDRPAIGRLAHEGIDVDSKGNVYVVDEHRGRSTGCKGTTPCGGGIYKFVPDTYGNLSSGSLYVLGIKKNTRRDNTGQGEWLGPIDAIHARKSGSDFGGASYQRPEDIEIIDGTLYVAITEGPRDEYGREYYEGRVISINLKNTKVSNFIKPGMNAPVETGKPGDANFQTGLDSVDNLATSPDGRLVIIEDNKPSDIWFASTKTNKLGASKELKLFASLTDPGAEGSGIYFSPTDPATLYVNVQHSAADDGDATWAITRNKRNHD